jgi:uncharacterized membrane protein required for colicin V production
MFWSIGGGSSSNIFYSFLVKIITGVITIVATALSQYLETTPSETVIALFGFAFTVYFIGPKFLKRILTSTFTAAAWILAVAVLSSPEIQQAASANNVFRDGILQPFAQFLQRLIQSYSSNNTTTTTTNTCSINNSGECIGTH